MVNYGEYLLLLIFFLRNTCILTPCIFCYFPGGISLLLLFYECIMYTGQWQGWVSGAQAPKTSCRRVVLRRVNGCGSPLPYLELVLTLVPVNPGYDILPFTMMVWNYTGKMRGGYQFFDYIQLDFLMVLRLSVSQDLSWYRSSCLGLAGPVVLKQGGICRVGHPTKKELNYYSFIKRICCIDSWRRCVIFISSLSAS